MMLGVQRKQKKIVQSVKKEKKIKHCHTKSFQQKNHSILSPLQSIYRFYFSYPCIFPRKTIIVKQKHKEKKKQPSSKKKI
jgi:hypothetical protein